jgi:transcriptional regulator with XRE-family HTH domain
MKKGGTSAIHHEAGVTNVIPRFPCFGEIPGFGKNQPDALERPKVETVLWGACYEFRTIAGNPHEGSGPSPRMVRPAKLRFGASNKVVRVFGIRNTMDRILFLHNSPAQAVRLWYDATALFGGVPMLPAGKSLRTLREKLGLTMRDVETSSACVADKYRNEEFSIPPSRLSDIETKGILPSIYRLYTLSVIYRRDIRELMSWYGVDLNNMAADLGLVSPPKSHVSDALAGLSSVQVPVRMDPGFDERRTTNLGRMVEQWGLVPIAYLAQFANTDFTYGYVGTQDFTMYPILPPGSFIQVDESKNKVMEGSWRSEYERPIYFVETREGHTCCWCSMRKEEIILQPHPLSPAPIRILRHPQEAEVLGQIVGVAMKLTEWHALDASPVSKGQATLN